MKLYISKLLFLSSVFSLLSCGAITKHTYYFNEIVVRNSTYYTVQDVKIRVDQTHRVFRCSNIAPRASCSNSFHQRKYEKNPLKITWTHHDRRMVTKEFVLQVPTAMDPNVPLRGVLEIKQDGTFAAYFEQDNH